MKIFAESGFKLVSNDHELIFQAGFVDHLGAEITRQKDIKNPVRDPDGRLSGMTRQTTLAKKKAPTY